MGGPREILKYQYPEGVVASRAAAVPCAAVSRNLRWRVRGPRNASSSVAPELPPQKDVFQAGASPLQVRGGGDGENGGARGAGGPAGAYEVVLSPPSPPAALGASGLNSPRAVGGSLDTDLATSSTFASVVHRAKSADSSLSHTLAQCAKNFTEHASPLLQRGATVGRAYCARAMQETQAAAVEKWRTRQRRQVAAGRGSGGSLRTSWGPPRDDSSGTEGVPSGAAGESHDPHVNQSSQGSNFTRRRLQSDFTSSSASEEEDGKESHRSGSGMGRGEAVTGATAAARHEADSATAAGAFLRPDGGGTSAAGSAFAWRAALAKASRSGSRGLRVAAGKIDGLGGKLRSQVAELVAGGPAVAPPLAFVADAADSELLTTVDPDFDDCRGRDACRPDDSSSESDSSGGSGWGAGKAGAAKRRYATASRAMGDAGSVARGGAGGGAEDDAPGTPGAWGGAIGASDSVSGASDNASGASASDFGASGASGASGAPDECSALRDVTNKKFALSTTCAGAPLAASAPASPALSLTPRAPTLPPPLFINCAPHAPGALSTPHATGAVAAPHAPAAPHASAAPDVLPMGARGDEPSEETAPPTQLGRSASQEENSSARLPGRLGPLPAAAYDATQDTVASSGDPFLPPDDFSLEEFVGRAQPGERVSPLAGGGPPRLQRCSTSSGLSSPGSPAFSFRNG